MNDMQTPVMQELEGEIEMMDLEEAFVAYTAVPRPLPLGKIRLQKNEDKPRTLRFTPIGK